MSHVGSVRWRDEEYAALERISEERRVSKNAVIVIAFRLLAGLPVPSWARQLREELERK